MKTLSIRQPWAHAILHLGKDVENRSWATRYRGTLLIHAGVRRQPKLCDALGLDADKLVYGAIVGSVEVVDCVRDYRSRWAEPEQWHWILRNPQAFATPIALAGRLGLFEPPQEIAQRLALSIGHETHATTRIDM